MFLKWPWCRKILENRILIHLFPKQRWWTSVNLLVRKVTWFMLTTTSTPLILSRAKQTVYLDYLYILTTSNNSFSYILTSGDSLALPASETQLNTRNMGAYILYDLFSFLFYLFGWICFSLAHSLRYFVKSRKRQTTNMGENTSFLEYIAIFLCIDTSREILSQHTFIVYRALLIFSLSPLYSC